MQRPRRAEAVCWDLEAYRSPGYQPSASDIDKIVDWFIQAPTRCDHPPRRPTPTWHTG